MVEIRARVMNECGGLLEMEVQSAGLCEPSQREPPERDSPRRRGDLVPVRVDPALPERGHHARRFRPRVHRVDTEFGGVAELRWRWEFTLRLDALLAGRLYRGLLVKG